MMTKFVSSTVALLLLFIASANLHAQEFNWAPDFAVGDNIPLLEAPDQDGSVRTLKTLTGDKGLVLFFNRSFDWCPYCKAQLVSLKAASQAIMDTGFNIATITYDPVATLKMVAEDGDIPFPLLHDEGIRHVNAFNILNTDVAPDSFAYGIPQPGIMLISPSGVIMAKFAEENYRMRPDMADIVEAAKRLAKPQAF